jgi:hypothetical protein
VKLILSFMAGAFMSVAVSSPVSAAGSADATGGQVVVVQALPGAAVDVAIDGKTVRRGAEVGSLVGPLSLSPGTHELAISNAPGGRTIQTRLNVKSGSNSDVVLHRPASVDGAPVVSTYRTPQSPIGPGKARILLAHTATVPPADVRFDGKIVFSNVANGEFADADVPAGRHRVALLPTGQSDDPILGPLAVDLAPRTATMVYAVGNPRNGSMNVVAHTVALSSDGSTAPLSIDTGSAGLAADIRVTPFSTGPAQSPDPQSSLTTADSDPDGWMTGSAAVLSILVLGAIVANPERRRRRRIPSASTMALGLGVREK